MVESFIKERVILPAATRQELVDRIISLIDPRWRDDFLNFVRSGKASAEFMAQIDHDPRLQAVLHIFVMEDGIIMELLGRALRGEPADAPLATPSQLFVALNRLRRLFTPETQICVRLAVKVVTCNFCGNLNWVFTCTDEVAQVPALMLTETCARCRHNL